ncbi:MAG: tripartite tricarboxylate transporter substrate binding protein, partial [Proteobacteria bacterium]|nr:tripartite tricarboxylate transporter substrate binding protein [Pseudomonadota bacterium]
MKRREFVQMGVGAAVGGAAGIMPMAHAQSGAFPNKPIKIMVGFAAGGVTDLVVRALAEAASTTLKQRVMVDNKPGAGGVFP